MSYLETLRGGIQAAKSGKRMLARVQFEQATEMDSHCPHGWLWSAWAADSPGQVLEFVEIALTRAPGHPLATQMLEVLQSLNEYEFKACGNPSCKTTCEEVCGIEFVEPELLTETPSSTWESVLGLSAGTLAAEELVVQECDVEVTEPTDLDEEDDADHLLELDAACEEEESCCEPSCLLGSDSLEMAADADCLLSDDQEELSEDDIELNWHADDEALDEAENTSDEEELLANSVDEELDLVAESLDELDEEWDAELAEEAELAAEGDEAAEADADTSKGMTAQAEYGTSETSASTARRWWDESPADDIAVDCDAVELCEATRLEEAVWCAADELQKQASDAATTESPLMAEAVEAVRAAEVECLESLSEPTCETVCDSVVEASSLPEAFAHPQDVTPGCVDADPADADAQVVRTILAVDDSPTVLKLVSMTLSAAGYDVVTAPNGIDAMKLLATMTPAMVLLDVNMPRMDGYKLCKLLKSHDKTRFIPVVMLSGKDGLFDKLRGKLVGCDDYISKPFESADLLRHVARYVPLTSGVTAS